MSKKHKNVDQAKLDLIDSPNAWTPEREDAWMEEVGNLTSMEIYTRYPPMKKPPNVSRRG